MSEKYMKIREFILENFETTNNMKDRLHTQDIIDILSEKDFSYSTCNMIRIFEDMEIGKHRSKNRINAETKAGYYYKRYKGKT
jgi:hypothetical protein